MAVFAVAHILLFNEVEIQGTRELTGRLSGIAEVRFYFLTEVVSDHAVISRCMLKGFDGEIKTGIETQAVLSGIHLGNDIAVVTAFYHNRHIFMVLRGGAHHGRPADIDIFNRVFQCAAGFCHGLRKRIKIHNHHINSGNLMLRHNLIIGAAAAEDPAVYFRMQGFDTSVHHFRKTGVIGDFSHRQTGVSQQAGSTAG